MRQINETNTISEILNTFTFGDKKSKGKSLSDTVKYSTLFSLWPDIVGNKLSKYTKPTTIKYSKLYVSAKSPVIVQEMNLLKDKIIKKINVYSNALDFNIKDIVLDYKNYENEKEEENNIEDKPEFYNNSDLDEVKLDDNFEQNIKKCIKKIDFLTEDQKQDFINKIYNNKKAQIKRLDN